MSKPQSSNTNNNNNTDLNATNKTSTISKRSKNGCVSCKNLKIKCTEEKPFCEYCVHTGRQCIYFQKPSVKIKVFKKKLGRPRKKSKESVDSGETVESSDSKDKIDISSRSTSSSSTPPDLQLINSKSNKNLNSPQIQLEITPFQLNLLKFYLEFGADFFTFNVLEKTHNFWEFEVPQLWCQSDLIKNSIYMLSSVRLLANYEESSFQNIHIEYDDNSNSQIVKNSSSISSSSSINLYQQAKHYLNKTYELMNMYQTILGNGISIFHENPSNDAFQDSSDIVGQILISNLCLTVACGMLSNESVKYPLDPKLKDISHFKMFEMIQIFKQFQLILNLNYSSLKNSKYLNMFGHDYSTPIQEPFIWSIHLRNYVSQNLDPLDFLQISCFNLISRIESCCHKAIHQSYPMALIHPIREVFLDEDLLTAFTQGNKVVVKIMYYLCSLLGIFDFKLSKGCTVWNEIIEFHKTRSLFEHDGNFEDDWDENVYNTLMARRECKIIYDFNLIFFLGKPVGDFMNGKIKLIKKDYPPVFF
ncbi:putative transcriptional regulatory protein [Wickerhamomyces ciferrii]|uniref:Transcriptional regulatory protein n=1 Tax=Wickerhamomyces ciferrii (strain ATCC 14091 / BCRC 22168 / CBS 111 / JCM 3599 / NBRC 0793 / NRRL Y-1031 F-60-10) TaxID=1206466 RepID=K0KIL0_WICCF|nr:putative transcriptional regulatory protein [Wickerhamomyces ciferrii]CCH42017.1 putative transcriptional regulatory protein [Wickerhamomyces ciferrii]